MRYVSTRGGCRPHSFVEAVAQGLAPDGGLFVPATLPDLSEELPHWEALSYADLCQRFLSHFASGLEERELESIVGRAYEHFDHPDIAPLVELEEGLHVLELFHGPTLAFKDFALQLLGNLYEAQIKRTNEPINVLGATSGDTGSAAIHGLLGREGVNIFILYPRGGVSPLQERQMTCTGADNVYAIGIDGTFDDAQKLVKATFKDQAFSRKHGLSAVNSINLARILAQCVYYICGYNRLDSARRQGLRYVVPTGNFGNVLAGWMAQKCGLPVEGFRVATNQNDILYRLFTTGQYEVGKVHPSLAPSMDIQVASNFERFLYYMEGCESEQVVTVMEALGRFGTYLFEEFDADSFSASRMPDARISEAIARIHERYQYVVDPHTACGFAEPPEPEANRIVLATAHPAKFPAVIDKATGSEPTHPSLETLKDREIVSHTLEAVDLEALQAFIAARV